MLELVDSRRHLQSLHQDALLPLNSDVLGPLHEAGQITHGLDVSSNSEVARVLFEQSTLLFLGTLGAGRSHHLLSLLNSLRLTER